MNILPDLWKRLNYLVPDPDCQTVGDDYDLIVWNDARQKPTLTECQDCYTSVCVSDTCSVRCDEVDALLAAKLAVGFTYNSVVYQVDRNSQVEILNRSVYAMNSIADATTYPWASPYNAFTAKNNTSQTFSTAADFQNFAKAVSDYCNGRWGVARGHKDALCLLTVEADIIAYDITTGW